MQTFLLLELSNRRRHKCGLLDEMERAVPWRDFLELIAPHALVRATGRRLFPIEAMMRIHFLTRHFHHESIVK